VAHELRNPLNGIVLHASLLRQAVPADSPARPNLEAIDREVRRLDRILQDFVKFTHPEDLKLEAVSLESALADSIEAVAGHARRKGVRIERDLPGGLPSVSGDRGLLHQAFVNLMLNACDAMREAGLVKVMARGEPGGSASVVIEDTGMGIAPEQLPRIFDLHYTTKEGGSGIGLALVRRTVRLHGGDIAVESTPGKGTRFTIKFPGGRT
jgi:signal transduction histidine kinase